MSTIAPKDKAFLDIKLVQECIDAHAKRIGLAFAEWVGREGYVLGSDYKWRDTNLRHNGTRLTEELYNKFIESITK